VAVVNDCCVCHGGVVVSLLLLSSIMEVVGAVISLQ